MFKIGNVEIHGKVVCAPMAGVTNKVFRKLVKSNGAALTYTEMTSNVGLKYNSEKTLSYADIDKDESPVSLQIFGGEVEDYVAAAKYFEANSNADIIDINMGCPVNKVAIKSDAGSALVKSPERIREIIRAVVKEIKKPLTVKIRIGWDENDLTYLEVAKIAEEEGAAAIAVHGRTRSQFYSGKANWQAIKEVKEAVSIPVIGNGDVDSPEAAKKMLDETGVDAVMVGRAAQNNPWIFKQINDYLETGKYDKGPSVEEVCEALGDFYKAMVDLKGQKVALLEIKGFAVNWLSAFPDARHIKNNLVRVKTEEEFFTELENIKAAL